MKVVDWLVIKWQVVNVAFIALGAACLFGMMMIDTVNIIGVQAGREIIPAPKVLIEELMTVVVFIGIGDVLLGRGHIKTDVVKKHFPPRLRLISDLASHVLIIGASGFVCWALAVAAAKSFHEHATVAASIPIPIAPFILVIAVSFFNMGLCAVILLAREWFSRGAT